MKCFQLAVVFVVLNLALASYVVMAEESGTAAFGGPNATENIIEEDAAEKGGFFEKRISQPWFDWKKKIRDEHGLSLGVDYSAVYLQSSENGLSGEDDAASGMVRFYGSWDLLGRGTKSSGAFVWKVEHRHKYTNIAPKAFGFDQGMVGLIVPPFSDEGTRWTNLFGASV